MTATSLQPPAQHAPAPDASATPVWRALVVLAGVVLVLLAAVWSWNAEPPVTPGPGEVVVDRGVARVEQVVSAARPQHAMPGMGTDDDPVAEGERRVSVDVTLAAPGDEPLRYAVDRFALRVAGGPSEAPHKSVLPGSELPPGTTLAGTLVFDVPVDATTAELSYDDGQGAVSVDLPLEGAADAPSDAAQSDVAPGHGDAGHS